MLVGLRGVGKTVLLDRILKDAAVRGIHWVRLEAPEDRSLPSLLAPALRAALIRLDTGGAAGTAPKKAMRVLASFVGAFKVRYGDVEVSIDVPAERGLAELR